MFHFKIQDTQNSRNYMFILHWICSLEQKIHPCNGNNNSRALFCIQMFAIIVMVMKFWPNCIHKTVQRSNSPAIITKHQCSLTVPPVSKDTPLYFKSCVCGHKNNILPLPCEICLFTFICRQETYEIFSRGVCLVTGMCFKAAALWLVLQQLLLTVAAQGIGKYRFCSHGKHIRGWT